MTPEELSAELARERVFPFHVLAEPMRLEAAQALDVRQLQDRETVTIEGTGAVLHLFVTRGEIVVEIADLPQRVVRAPAREVLAPVAPGNFVRVTARAGAILAIGNADLVDDLLIWDQTARAAAAECDHCAERVESVRKCRAFREIAPELVPEIIRGMSSRSAGKGEEIVRQGDPGDSFFVLVRGRAEVWERDAYDPGTVKVNEIGPGDGFGEHALLTGGLRSATVRMTEDGELLVLAADDYRQLVANRVLHEIDADVVPDLISHGHQLLDVRYDEEHEESRIPDSRLIPLQRLRQRVAELDSETPYIVYCRSGKRSAVAATLLGQFGIHALSLRGGITGWPFATESDF